MRKIVAGFACSLDGYIEAPDGAYDWILTDKEIDFREQMKRYDTYFYGRKTYEAVIKYMEKTDASSAHYVFSHSLKTVQKGFTLVQGDTFHEVTRIKSTPGKDIAVFGGAGLLASLLNLQLVDEIAVSIIPVLLGAGKPMVELLNEKVWLRLMSTKSYSIGSVALTYEVKKKGS
jgi:dihydrofolate reductase